MGNIKTDLGFACNHAGAVLSHSTIQNLNCAVIAIKAKKAKVGVLQHDAAVSEV